MKKSLVLLLCGIFAVNAAFGQSTITQGNVTYSYTPSITTSEETATQSVTIGSVDYAQGIATLTVKRNVNKTTTYTCNLTVESVGAGAVSFNSWSANSDPDFSNRASNPTTEDGGTVYAFNTSYAITSEWNTWLPTLKQAAANDVVTYDDIINSTSYQNVTYVFRNKNYTQTQWEANLKKLGATPDFTCYYHYRDIDPFAETTEDYFYAITAVKPSYNDYLAENAVHDYNITSIPAGCITKGVTSLTIGKSITNIEAGALSNATTLKEIVVASANYDVDSNNFLYTSNYGELVGVPGTISGTSSAQAEYTLEENTASVAENALANVNYVTLYSAERISQSNLGGTGNILTTNTGDLKQGTVSYTLESNAFVYAGDHNGQVPTGDVTRQNLLDLISGLTENSDVAYIDLTKNTVVFKQHNLGEITGLKNNCLLYLPAGVTATGNNVIIDGKCENLVLTDKKTFYAPYKFEVTGSVKYTGRTFTEGVYGTMVLPFSIVPATSISIDGVASKYGKAFRVAMLDSYDSEGNIKFQNQSAMPANVALLVKPLTSFSELVVSDPDGITISNTPSAMEYSVGTGDASAMFAGTYTQGKSKLTATETTTSQDATRYPAGSSAWILSATTGNMKKVTSGKTVNLGSFRGMFVITDPVAASAKPCFRVFDYADTEEGEEDIAIEEDQTTDITSANVAPATIDVESQNGKLVVSADGVNVNLASVSGTTYFSGKVDGQKTFDLPAGVYVVNGKKFIVK